MDEIRALLSRLGLPSAPTLDESVLYPGDRRFSALESALARMLGDRASSFLGLISQPDELDEDGRINRLVAALQLLGVKASADTVRGEGTSEERVHFLLEVLNLSATAADMAGSRELASGTSQGCSTMLHAAAGMQAALFSEREELFPSDVRKAMDAFGGDRMTNGQLEEALAATQEQVEELHVWLEQHHMGEASSSQDWVPLETELQRQLKRFSDASTEFVNLFDEEFSVLAKEVPRPQLYGIGPAATRTLHKYRQLVEMLQGIRDAKTSFSTMQGELAPTEVRWLQSVSEQSHAAIKRLEATINVLSMSKERASSRAMLTPVKA